ncbi:ligand-binding protein SH3 [Candidatus Uhrbacteria bacterium CG_4_9_14_3_um_filter_50_9]|uniref:Ligand-binding protein SH3 n=1 Tax=Candidatus Uhrbacteria bacterium CG_4_9_14_3_um_filter_50_9 TaxID=1975035 RepID=A0A2M7XEM3_9BACT|nr:MAG: ligand-binding protein SH3 [Candidatus Uhrbacteria bacterium CG_4_9_14_3_um_filter_50_9]
MNALINYISTFPPEIAAALLAILPLTELRAALPIAITVFGMEPGAAYAWTVLGNLVPIILVFWLLPPTLAWARKQSPWLKHVLDDYFAKLERKHHDRFQRYGALALFFFVAIPLPGSGVWTGSVLAILFGLEQKRALSAIVGGLLVAGIIVLLIIQGVLGALSFLL